MNYLSEIHDDILGSYSIRITSDTVYKVYKRKDCVKLDVYKKLRSEDINVSEEDINKYFILVSTHNSLFLALVAIAENNMLFDKTRVIGFFTIISEFKRYVESIK